MLKKNNNEYVNWNAQIPVIRYKKLEECGCVDHGFSTRLGGVSQGVFASMNLSYSRGDCRNDVDQNFELFASQVHMDWKKIVSTDQTHTANVRVVSMDDAGTGIVSERNCNDIDGQITNVPGLPLITYHADCVPLFFVDPVQKCIGLSHSGWRGTAGRIGEKTVTAMCETYGSTPTDILAVIGPSICQKCYEVSEDVIEHFIDGYEQNAKLFYKKENGKFQLNLWEANRQILRQSGIPEENITITEWCTCCHPDLLWSHRVNGAKRGSLAAFLCLRG